MNTDKLYTGQREMAGLGIYHYGARFYSPKLGRFLSADSIVPNASNPQDFNRYSYVRNNPVRYTDPSGNIPIDCWNDPSYCSNTTTLHESPYASTTGDGGGGGGRSGTPTTITSSGGSSRSSTGGLQIPDQNVVDSVVSEDPTLDLSGDIGGGWHPLAMLDTGNVITAIPSLPPSPFACGWFDCALSVVGFVASMFTMTEVPTIVGVAFGVDLIVTVIAIVRTEGDYSQGDIDNVYRLSLHSTAVGGLIPGPFGAGVSFMNVLVTLSGYPSDPNN